MKTLGDLLNALQAAGLLMETWESIDNIDIDHVAGDSRKVGPNGLFVAIPGVEVDGHLFIDKAVKNGAIAIVCEAVPENRAHRYPGAAFARVHNSRSALAELAAAWYDNPSHALRIVGVTGTNGKTTVAFLVQEALGLLGVQAGFTGTVGVRMAGEEFAARLTTPDALYMQRLLRRMADKGCDTCAMEVSSHALDQERVRGIAFDVAVFTNLTHDHLDYHPTFSAYFAAKKTLFDRLDPNATALFNADDPAGARMVADTRAARTSYGLDAAADIHAEVVEDTMEGLVLRVDGRARRFRLAGRFNAYNLLAAWGALLALGCDAGEALDALEEARSAPGRFERIRFEDGTHVVIDYAHTPAALQAVLETITAARPPGAHVWCVFGCGGDRDRTKRPMMGAVAERFTDHLIVTSDNPRTEDPARIMQDIRAGLTDPDRALLITDRGQAIAEASRLARPGDIVLVAGKGHETRQIVGTDAKRFDDREAVRAAFARRPPARLPQHPR
ncbi:MAG: UDP-N-acetylmuramoyl-L-alanyl-D-glutamate--2,6-diaminopimelate ligase [Bacteroidetes bacterium SB0662_bin_6]|nr:UDP-N-acetylmuramoyl-L-alanyl-D-glutamate--2,6-diaminopimelate ligase [Bacteroidetes bacterium SB0668_bin_1]MYE05404.1 UDP-N-acetylmuramoyl-L-alanyl-D-glutamate--2,6-diaminopimelate ligase [Bacteroidetes bacterium SB0662_bin_6]